jgi:hypothetical protein
LAAFQEHVRQNVSSRDFKRVRTLKANSLYLSATDLRQRMVSDAFRILSIDGAHSWYHTVSDLTLADSVIRPGGVVIVDDITNCGWPGVMEGVARYLLLSAKRRLFPFAIGRNKLWLTTPEYHELYLNQAMSDANPVYAPYEKRMSEFFGTKVAGF